VRVSLVGLWLVVREQRLNVSGAVVYECTSFIDELNLRAAVCDGPSTTTRTDDFQLFQHRSLIPIHANRSNPSTRKHNRFNLKRVNTHNNPQDAVPKAT
jgi:hypothetical protein